MRIIFLTLLIFIFCVNFYAQDKTVTNNTNTKFEFEIGDNDGCGSGLVESQTYAYRQGKIIKIISANKILFEQNSAFGGKDKEKFTITLVGINADYNKENIKKFLEKYSLNQSIQVVGNTRKDADKNFGGVIRLFNENEEIDELNDYLLESGIAKYKDFNSDNLVPYYMPCRLEKAEQRAKETKLGIWAK